MWTGKCADATRLVDRTWYQCLQVEGKAEGKNWLGQLLFLKLNLTPSFRRACRSDWIRYIKLSIKTNFNITSSWFEMTIVAIVVVFKYHCKCGATVKSFWTLMMILYRPFAKKSCLQPAWNLKCLERFLDSIVHVFLRSWPSQLVFYIWDNPIG